MTPSEWCVNHHWTATGECAHCDVDFEQVISSLEADNTKQARLHLIAIERLMKRAEAAEKDVSSLNAELKESQRVTRVFKEEATQQSYRAEYAEKKVFSLEAEIDGLRVDIKAFLASLEKRP